MPDKIAGRLGDCPEVPGLPELVNEALWAAKNGQPFYKMTNKVDEDTPIQAYAKLVYGTDGRPEAIEVGQIVSSPRAEYATATVHEGVIENPWARWPLREH